MTAIPHFRRHGVALKNIGETLFQIAPTIASPDLCSGGIRYSGLTVIYLVIMELENIAPAEPLHSNAMLLYFSIPDLRKSTSSLGIGIETSLWSPLT